MTEREQIEQRIAENERKMAESERVQEELQRKMAKQIKELLDLGIPKADIAKTTEFSLEYIDSLLEKFYPQTAGTERTSDIESQLNFLKQQVQILQKKLDNQEFENVQLKQQLNTIQSKGANMAENNEPIQTQQAVQQWEYMQKGFTTEQLNELGKEGWEAVGLTNNITLLKRPKPAKKRPAPDYGYSR